MQIIFEFEHPIYGLFRDALHLPDDHEYSDNEIAAMKQQRFDNWVAHIEAPPVEETAVIATPVQE